MKRMSDDPDFSLNFESYNTKSTSASTQDIGKSMIARTHEHLIYSPTQESPITNIDKISMEVPHKTNMHLNSPSQQYLAQKSDVHSTGGSTTSSPERQKTSTPSRKNQANDAAAPIEKALMEMAPRKAKRMFDRRKRARMNGDDDTDGLWDNISPAKVKSHSPKQIQRISNELEQVLGVLCNGDKSYAADVLAHLMTKRHMGSDLFQNVEKKISYFSERSLDNRIVDGIVGFFDHHHSRGTRPTEAAHAVDAVMVACCWDICDSDDVPPGVEKSLKTNTSAKRVSNSALIDRLGVNRGTLKRARTKAKSIKVEGKSHYKPEDRKPRKDKGVPARLYSVVKKVEETAAPPRQKNEYAAIDALSTMVTDKENNQRSRDTSGSQHVLVPQLYSQPLNFPPQNPALAAVVQNQNQHLGQMVYRYNSKPMQSNERSYMFHENNRTQENTGNMMGGGRGQMPSGRLPMNIQHGYNQYLQLNSHMLQSPNMGGSVMDNRNRQAPPNMQGNMNSMQAPMAGPTNLDQGKYGFQDNDRK